MSKYADLPESMTNVTRRTNTTSQLPGLLSCSVAIALLTFPVAAQDADTIPLAASIQQPVVNLPAPLGITTIKYSVSGGTVFHYPIYKLYRAEIRVGGQLRPFANADGSLVLSSGGAGAALDVQLFDLLRDPSSYQPITNAIASRPDVPRGAIFRFPEVLPDRPARIILRDPNDQQRVKVLDEVNSLTGGEGTIFPRASFLLDAADLALLSEGPISVLSDHLEVQVEERYRAQFRTTDLEVSLSEVEQALNQVRRRLAPMPDGQPSGLLLSPKVPVGLSQSGTVEAYNELTTVLQRIVQIEVLQRQGATVDSTLASRFVEEALAFAREQQRLDLQISAADRQSQVATFLLADDLSITLPLGRLDEVAAEIRDDRNQEWSRAFQEARLKKQTNKVQGQGSASFLGGLFGGSASADVDRSWERSDYVEEKLHEFSRQLSEASARIKGDVPYLTGIRFSVDGRVENVRFTEIRSRLGSFTNGYATLSASRGLAEVAANLDAAQRYEAVLVPQILVGGDEQSVGVVGYDGWQQGESWWVYKDVAVSFSRPFAATPRVLLAIQTMNYSTPPEFLSVRAINVSSTGFTARFMAHPQSIYYWAHADWIAVGESIPLGATSGAFRIPEAIPVGDRAWIQTPRLDLVASPRGEFQPRFNSIPGRTYLMESSEDLVNWRSLGQVSASSFTTGHSPATGELPQEFFRVSTR